MARVLPAILIGLLASTGIARAGTSFVGGGISITTSNHQALSNASIGLMSGFGWGGWPGCWNGIGIYNPVYYPSYAMYYHDGSWYWYGPIYDGLPLIEQVRREDPELMRAIIGPTMPEPDAAMVDLHAGRYTDAARQFLSRAEKRERDESEMGGSAIVDRTALRLYGLAMAGAGDLRGASAAFAEAHREDPLLGSDPILGHVVLSSASEVRRIVLEGIEFAKRDNTAQSWELVGYLMQAQGRYDESRAMLARAATIVQP
jgi:tetratricopeptide (TPR) repeat protein